jgi:hypothetical protein
MVRRLAQVGGPGFRVELRPQRIDDPVAAQPVLRLKAEQLHEVCRAKARPALGRQLAAIEGDSEAAEELDQQGVGGDWHVFHPE